MRWRELSLIAFDTETTGLHPEEGHRVIEFAGIEFRLNPDGSIKQAIPHHYLFNPEIPIPKEATEVSGIRDEDVAKSPVFAQHAQAIHKLLSTCLSIAHNFPFDQRFLSYEFSRVGLRWPSPPAEIDTLDLSRAFFPEARSHKLVELAARLDIPLQGAHRATNDAEACGRCFFELARRQNAPDDLAGLLDWAGAVGHPPETGHLGRSPDGSIIFLEGEHKGDTVESHPDSLMWMTVALQFVGGQWRKRYPEAVCNWIERWLRCRASGRALGAGNMKGFGPAEWGIDLPLSAA
jgi:DNA polymerase III epsilon subunit-like protein